jgi:hypothetical protein
MKLSILTRPTPSDVKMVKQQPSTMTDLLPVDDLIKIQPLKSTKYVPKEMLEGIAKSLATFDNPELVTDETKIKYTDRYVVYDNDENLTMAVFQVLVYWIRRFSWEDSYVARFTDDQTEKQLTRVLPILQIGVSPEYSESLQEDHYYMQRYIPSPSHGSALKHLSELTGVAFHKLIARDMDMRIRKDRFISPTQSIRTSYGVDYLYLRYYDKDAKRFKGGIFNIGNSCIICFKEKQFFKCVRCGEATYCSIEHQKRDWPRHKGECCNVMKK